MFTSDTEVKSIHFVVLKFDRTSGVCPDTRRGHKGVCGPAVGVQMSGVCVCALVCIVEYSKDVFSLVEIILISCPLGLSKSVFLS